MELTAKRPSQKTRDAAVKYHPLAIVLISCVLGAIGDRLFRWPWSLELSLAVAAGLSWVRQRRRLNALWPLLMLGTFATAFSHHVAWRLAARGDLHACLDSQPVSAIVEAIITQPLSLRGVSLRSETRKAEFAATAVRIRDGDHWRPTHGQFKVTVSLPVSTAARFVGSDGADRLGVQPAWRPGDRVRLLGELRTHPPPMNPGDWDPANSRRTRRESLMRVASPEGIELLQAAAHWSPRRCLWRLRANIERCLRRHIASGQADLAVALLLGKRESLDFQQRQTFIHSGTAHLLALSGLHVGLLASFVWLLGRAGLLSRRFTCLLAGATAVAYLLMAGPRASLVRATVLIVAMAWGRWLGRPRAAWNGLALAALVLVIGDPSQVFDTGAQLSFLAVAALCRWGSAPAQRLSPLEELIVSSRSRLRRLMTGAISGFRQWVVLSAVVWLITAPVAAWRFGLLAPIGILLNPVAGPLVAVALYGAVLTNGMAWWPHLAAALGQATAMALGSVQWLAQWGAAAPGGHWQVSPPPAEWAAVGCALWCVWAIVTRRTTRWTLAFATACWLGWGATYQLPARTNGLTATVLAVGHGSCIVIRTPQQKVWVYDAGQLGGGSLVYRALTNCLALQRDKTIDGLIISHEDADHYNAVARIIQSIPTRQILVGPRMLNSAATSIGVRQLMQAIHEAGIAAHKVHQGETVWIDPDVAMEVLHPPAFWRGGLADNADSLVVRLRFRGRAILLTGDVEGPGLARLFARSVRADVVLAPHHGSPNSHPAAVAGWCGARWVVVSSGHIRPHLDAIDAHVLQTARDGAVTIRVNEAGITVTAKRK